MGPAIRVPGVVDLYPPRPCRRSSLADPDGEPGGGWLVVQNNWVAQRIVERALTVGFW